MSNEKELEVSPNVEMTDVDSHATLKRKRSEKSSSTVTQFTNSPNYQLDALTAHLHLRAALSQFLGLHGTAIPVDILKLHDNNVHIRVPREDASAVVIAVGGWVGKTGEGWRVKNSGSWGAGLHSSTAGSDLFK
jgi:ribonuclease P/MRP protein subunit POP8